MRKWECIVCGWVYDEAEGADEEGIAPGTLWEDVPAGFLCPECGVGKEDFELIEDSEAPEPEPESEPAPAEAGAAERPPVVIIGAGLAGYHAAKEFRKHDRATPLKIITSDDGSFYSKPMLSTGFTRETTAQDLATSGPAQVAEELHAEMLNFTEVREIDTEAHALRLGDGGTVEYGKLVLACGSEAVEPPLEGNALDRMYTVNSLAEYDRFRKALEQSGARKLLIIGAGLIGSEFANDLCNGGFELEAVEPLDRSLPLLLPEPGGRAVQTALERRGVKFHFGAVAERVDRAAEGDGVVATLSNGEQVSADLVLSAIGVRPRTGLAQQAGLEVNRGIVVDRLLQTSAKDVYALGDCAEVEGLVLFYVAPLTACARALGRTLAGEETRVEYPAMPVTIKTPFCPVVVAPPPKGAEGNWQCRQHGLDVVAEFRNSEGALLGFALTGEEGIKDKVRLQKELPPLLP